MSYKFQKLRKSIIPNNLGIISYLDDINSIKPIYEWALSESNELLAFQTCLKYYKKLEQRIEAFMAKHKLSANLN